MAVLCQTASHDSMMKEVPLTQLSLQEQHQSAVGHVSHNLEDTGTLLRVFS